MVTPESVAPCCRFEKEGLLLLERGVPLGEPLSRHFEDCSDCQEARRVHEALRSDLSRVGEGLEAHAGWQEAVRQRIKQRNPEANVPSPQRSWTLWAGLAAAVLALATVSLFLLPASSPTLTVSVQKGPSSLRGAAAAQPGDLLVMTGTFGRSDDVRDTELRLYRNDRLLVARCPGSEGCEMGRRRMRLSISLSAIGTYQPVWVYGPGPLPEAGAGLDLDSGAVLDAGGNVQVGTEIEVR